MSRGLSEVERLAEEQGESAPKEQEGGLEATRLEVSRVRAKVCKPRGERGRDRRFRQKEFRGQTTWSVTAPGTYLTKEKDRNVGKRN